MKIWRIVTSKIKNFLSKHAQKGACFGILVHFFVNIFQNLQIIYSQFKKILIVKDFD
ncbi:hypothetical protein PRV_02315 [Mycoplasma parvum str. Indiana]|uniref:Uncharacterized protein n=1 Tax=Mycoplasma parvum str. Indiana TaxID=1403316 RepID=U5NC92_9MOLU|nr:hypothetical protein PRV_02315 [Mycoplasma parvum str. Indiana]